MRNLLLGTKAITEIVVALLVPASSASKAFIRLMLGKVAMSLILIYLDCVQTLAMSQNFDFCPSSLS